MNRNLLIMALLSLTLSVNTEAVTLEFTLLTWNDQQATPELPSAVGIKPSQSSQPCDWLLFTGDDYVYPDGWNPLGAISHNFADPAGDGGSTFAMAPSLTCITPLALDFTPISTNAWNVQPASLAYTGDATSFAQMNQFLILPGDPATLDSTYNVDGQTSLGTWNATSESNWILNYSIDFYLATNTDGNGAPQDIDATFDNCIQAGYLIPKSKLTLTGLADVELDDPAGFFTGDFKSYLLNQIAPRLPENATALLVTQMAKTNPVFTDVDVSITLASRVGNTTIAYTFDPLPVPYDLNGDGDVDVDDFDILENCLAGPGASLATECTVADLDNDNDVDLHDFSVLQRYFTGN